jgi:L-2-hydroxycarboxylate dehydrogenase (NAD+)
LLCGVLTGANFGGEVKSLYFDHSEPQNVGHLVIAIRPDLFMSKEQFTARMDTFVGRVKDLPRAQGFDEIQMPGEPEARKAAMAESRGITLPPAIAKDLRAEARHLEVPADFLAEA